MSSISKVSKELEKDQKHKFSDAAIVDDLKLEYK